MEIKIAPEIAPLQIKEDCVIRVGNTRVTLDTVISVFKQGTTAEEIAYRYPSLSLADIYSAIAFYLNHQSEVEAYLRKRQQEAEEIRSINEAKANPKKLRERLIARQKQKEIC